MAEVYRETRETETDAETPATTARSEYHMTVAERVIYLIGGILLGLLAIRFVLSLLGANRGNGFADFIYSVTHPFVAPFFGLFSYKEQFGTSRFEFETLIAMLVYGLVMVVLAKLVTIGSRQPR